MSTPPHAPTPGDGIRETVTTRRVTTSRTVRLVRPHRVVRTAEETATVWGRRGRSYLASAFVWAVLTVLFAADGFGATAVILAAAAAAMSLAVVVKARVLVHRAERR